jgi:hypothetical protein
MKISYYRKIWKPIGKGAEGVSARMPSPKQVRDCKGLSHK